MEKCCFTTLASTSLIWLQLWDVQPTDTVMKRNILKRMSQLEASGESVRDLTGIKKVMRLHVVLSPASREPQTRKTLCHLA